MSGELIRSDPAGKSPAKQTKTALAAPDGFDPREIIVRTLRDELMQSKSLHTRKAYEDDVLRFYKVKAVHEITADMVLGTALVQKDQAARMNANELRNAGCSALGSYALQYKKQMMDDGLAGGTIQRRFAFICTYYDLLSRMKVIAFNPLEKKLLRLPNASKTVMRTSSITDDEAKRILAVPDRATWHGARDYCLMVFALCFGLRRSELVRLNVQDIREIEKDKLGFEVVTKGGKARKCLLDERLEAVYASWLKLRGTKDGPVFLGKGRDKPLTPQQVWNIVDTTAEAAGVQRSIKTPTGKYRKYVHPHSFRATNITKIISEHGIDKAQSFHLHESPSTTLAYAENQPIDQSKLTDSFKHIVGPDQPEKRKEKK